MSDLKPDTFDFAAYADRVTEQNRPFLPLDYTPASIAALDCFIDETWGDSGASPDTDEWQPSDGKWNTILGFGIYFGEFLVRRYGGAWVRYEAQPDSLLNIGVVFPNGLKVFPVAKVWKRFKNGVEDSIAPLYLWLRSQLNDEPGVGEWHEWFDHGNWFMGVKRPDRAIPFFRRALACPLTDDHKRELEAALQSALHAETAAAGESGEPETDGPPGARPEETASTPSSGINLQVRCVAEVRRLVSDGERDRALALIHKALGHMPDDPELNELLGDQLAQRKDIPGAMAAYEKGTRRWESARSWEGLGICRSLTGDTEGALTAWREAANRDLKRATPCLRLALAEEKRGNKLNALEWYRSVLERNPADEKNAVQARERIAALENDPEQLQQQADRLADQGDTAGAIAAYERIAALTPTDSRPLREAGVGYALLKQFDKALECLDRAIRINVSDHQAWDFKAITQARMEKFALALDTVDQGLSYCLDAAQLWWRRSFLLGKLNRFPEAIIAANKALELDPEDGTPYLFRFDAQRHLGRTAEALDSINRHIAWVHPRDHRKGIESMKLRWELENPGQQLDPQQAAERQEYAFHSWQTGSLEQSLAAYREAVELDPFSYEIWNNYGSSLSGIGRHEEAIACFDRAHELYPMITDFLSNKAMALARLSRNEEALACHEEILRKYPKAEKSLDERARLLSVLERHAEAMAAAEAFAVAYPGRSDAHVRHSWALQKLGRNDEALVAIDRAIASEPGDRNLWLRKSIILGDLGRDDEAEDLQTHAFEDKEFADRYHQEGLELFRKLGI
jgi:tetratricopeptide (TPR) repeat protein